MGFLQDRKILVTGLLSNRSIAYGISKALARTIADAPGAVASCNSSGPASAVPSRSAANASVQV